MEQEDADVRKRKRDGEAKGDAGVVDGEAWGGCYEKAELGDEEEEYEGIAEESVEEVMRWLEMEISLAPEEEGPPGFVTINGNEESCGPSFSAAASTVMASVDTRAGAPPPPPVPWPWPSAEAAHEYEQLMAADVAELIDGEWLVELLAGGPATEEQ